MLFSRVVAKNVFGLPSPSAGDYRSNVVTGLWSDITTWQTFDGTSWIAASTPPTSSAGVITISSGDSIRVNTATTMDQVVIESGAILAIFNSSTTTTFTLDDGAGDDIVNNGKLYVSINATLTGAGTIQNNIGGTFILRNQGILSVNASNDGSMTIMGTGNMQNATLTNNGTITLVNFTLNLNSSTLVNNDSISIAYNADAFIATTAGTGSLVNAASGVIYKLNSTGIGWVNPSVAFSNAGVIKGVGQFNLLNTTSNTGTIAPGNSPGQLTVNPSFVTGKTPVIDLEISSTGAVAGINYDQLIFSTVGSTTTNVTGSSLHVADHAGDPIGTTYTFITSPSGTIVGPFASVQLSPSLGNLVYTAGAVTVQKMSALPLTWGTFSAVAGDDQVTLHWNTLQESNTSHIAIQRSRDGQQYVRIGEVAAQGNSPSGAAYSFIDPTPVGRATNYYRLQEVDLDGRSTYSVVRAVYFNGDPAPVTLAPNPVTEILRIKVREDDISIQISDLNGKIYRDQPFRAGTHELTLGNLPSGVYQVLIYQKNKKIAARRILKL